MAVTDEEFEQLLGDAQERPEAVRALRHADDIWRSLVEPTAGEGERVAWRWLRARLTDSLLQLWEPTGRNHDPQAMTQIPAPHRNDVAAESWLLALGGLNLLTIVATEIVQEEAGRRAI